MTPELKAAVEKVARQLAANRMLLRGDPTGARLPDELWQQCSRDALAAIRAVAEVTKEARTEMQIAWSGAPRASSSEWSAMHAASILGEALRDE